MVQFWILNNVKDNLKMRFYNYLNNIKCDGYFLLIG